MKKIEFSVTKHIAETTVFDQEISALRHIRNEHFSKFGIACRPPEVERWNALWQMKADLERTLKNGQIGLDGVE